MSRPRQADSLTIVNGISDGGGGCDAGPFCFKTSADAWKDGGGGGGAFRLTTFVDAKESGGGGAGHSSS